MSARGRADWFVAHDHVEVWATEDLILADVVNEHGERRRVEWTPDGWSCTCEHGRVRAHSECSHILAVRIVAARRRVEPVMRVTLLDSDQLDVLEHLDDLLADRDARRAVHRERLERTARWLGVEVGAGRVLAADADRRLDAMIRTTWRDIPVPLFVIAWDTSRPLALAAFAQGLRAGQRQLREELAA